MNILNTESDEEILKEIEKQGLAKELSEEEKSKLDKNETPIYIGIGIADYS